MTSKLNDWSLSKPVGERVEDVVRRALNDIGFDYAKNNADIKQAVDLAADAERQIEVKCAFTPYPRTPTPAGLSNADHITLDHANIMKYEDDVVLFIVVGNYPLRNGLFSITAGKCKDLIRAQPWRIYNRSTRTMRDKVKKIGVSIDECLDLSHIIAPVYMAELMSIAVAAR